MKNKRLGKGHGLPSGLPLARADAEDLPILQAGPEAGEFNHACQPEAIATMDALAAYQRQVRRTELLTAP